MTASEVVQQFQSVSAIAKQAKLSLSDQAIATLVMAMNPMAVTVQAPGVTVNPTDLAPVVDAMGHWCGQICTRLSDIKVTVQEGRTSGPA